MPKQNENFRVLIRPLTGDSQPGDPRERFWQQVREHPLASNSPSRTNEQFEAELEQRFGDQLHRLLVEYFHDAWQGPGRGRGRNDPDRPILAPRVPSDASLLPLVNFKASVLGYHSLELGVAVAGAENLAKLFDDNYDLLAIFLGAYVPQAFEQTLSWYDTSTSHFRFDVSLEPEFVEDPVHRAQRDDGSPKAMSQSLPLSDRAHRVWMIANFSLVVPVLLALLVLYVAFNHVSVQQTDLVAATSQLTKREERLLNAYEARIADLEKVNLDLLKVSSSSRSSQASHAP